MLFMSLSAATWELRATVNTPVLLGQPYLCVSDQLVWIHMCVLWECVYLCVCVINATAEHVVVDGTVIARSATLLWLRGGL